MASKRLPGGRPDGSPEALPPSSDPLTDAEVMDRVQAEAPIEHTSQDLQARMMRKRLDLKPPEGFFRARYPSLWKVLVPDKDLKGRKIEPAFIGFTADGDSWKVTLRVPVYGMQTGFSISEPSEIWEMLEYVLNDAADVVWRATKTTPAHLREGGA